MKASIAWPMLGALLVAACGGSEFPAPHVADSKAAISAAEAVGAEQNPRAALHLKLAKDQLASAEKLINDGENEEAVPVLERAEVDANLAMTLARVQATEREAQESQQKVQELKQQAQ